MSQIGYGTNDRWLIFLWFSWVQLKAIVVWGDNACIAAAKKKAALSATTKALLYTWDEFQALGAEVGDLRAPRGGA